MADHERSKRDDREPTHMLRRRWRPLTAAAATLIVYVTTGLTVYDIRFWMI